MKKIYFYLLALAVTAAACRKDREITEISIENPTPVEFTTASIGGLVVDENGTGVPGAKVVVGDQHVVSNDNGAFLFRGVRVNKNAAYVLVEHPNFFHGSRTLAVRLDSRNTVEIQLLSNEPVKTISSETGGVINGDHYSVTLPATGFVHKSNGSDYSGPVAVSVKRLDPTDPDFGMQMPGDFTARAQSGNLVSLASVGMLAVELKSSTGVPLQLKPGYEADLRIRVPSTLLASAPEQVPMWYFDEQAGIWVEEGSATMKDGYYEGKVRHFSYWNFDVSNSCVQFTGKFTYENGEPITNVKIEVSNSSGIPLRLMQTDDNGYVGGYVPTGIPLKVVVRRSAQICDGTLFMYEQSIGTLSADLDMIITVPGNWPLTVLKGNLRDCDGEPVTYGYCSSSLVPFVWVDENGDFNSTWPECESTPELQIVGYDLTHLQQSLMFTVQQNNQVFDAGTVSVCSILDEYFRYEFDGQVIIATSGQFLYTMPNDTFHIIGTLDDGFILIGGRTSASTGVYTDCNVWYYKEFGGFGGTLHGCPDNDACDVTVTFTQVPSQVIPLASGYFSGTASKYNTITQAWEPVNISGDFKLRN